MDIYDYKLVRDKKEISCSECCFDGGDGCNEPEGLDCIDDSCSDFYHWELR